MTSAAAVSAALRRIGYSPVGSETYKREGVRVKNSAPGRVRVTADFDSDTRAYRTAAQIAEDLRAHGFTVVESQLSPNAMWVSR